jgi:glutamyl-tRNA synthetase
MNHLNGEYIRDLSLDTFVEMGEAVLRSAGLTVEAADSDTVRAVLAVCQEKVRVLSELPEYTRFFFYDQYPVDEKALNKALRKEQSLDRLRELERLLADQADFSPEGLERAINGLIESTGQRHNDYFAAARVAVSGVGGGPGFYDLIHLIGKERSLDRIARFLKTHGACYE